MMFHFRERPTCTADVMCKMHMIKEIFFELHIRKKTDLANFAEINRL